MLLFERRFLVFRHCAKHTQKLGYMHGEIAYVVRDIQLASELIHAQGELGQIDEFAELLGQFSCKK